MDGLKGPERRKVAPLTAIALSIIKLVSGEPAQAQDPWKPKVVASEKTPKLRKAPELKREGVIRMPETKAEHMLKKETIDGWVTRIGREGSMPDISESIVPSSERLVADLEEFERRMAPGGRYEQMLHNESLTRQELNMIINQISHFSGMLLQVQAGKIPSNPRLEKYLLRERPIGLSELKLPARMQDGNLRQTRCMYMRVAYQGKLGMLSNRHCIDIPGKFQVLESQEWEYDMEGEDVALKIIPEDGKPAMAIHPGAIRAKQARFAKFNSVNRFGESVEYYTYLMPLTVPVLKILWPNLNVNSAHAQQLLKGYWYPAPPGEQRPGHDGKGARAKGESGTPPRVLMPGMGFVLGGPLHSGPDARIDCEDSERGVCTSIMFSASLQSVVDLFERAAARR